MKKFFIIVAASIAINLYATGEVEGTYTAKSDNTKEIYELNLNIEKDEAGEDAYYFHLTKALQEESGLNETCINGKYKIDKNKIILYGESITGNTNSDNKQKYKGNPIRVHVRNEDNKTVLVLSAFGKILKLAKQS